MSWLIPLSFVGICLLFVVVAEVFSGHLVSDAKTYFSEDTVTTDDFADRAALDLEPLSKAEARDYLAEKFAAVARRAAAAERSRCLSHLEHRMGQTTDAVGRDLNEALCAVHEVVRSGR